MARSVWKGPFVEESLIKKVEKIKNDPNKKPIKTWSRKSTIIPDFVGVSVLIYNGKKFNSSSSTQRYSCISKYGGSIICRKRAICKCP